MYFHRMVLFGLLSLVLSVGATAAPTAKTPAVSQQAVADAVPVFVCDFGADCDRNYDNWPDRWTRAIGEEFPHYVEVAIEPNDDCHDNSALAMRLDGASARIESPPIPILPKFSYLLRMRLRAVALKHSHLEVIVELRDANGTVLQVERSSHYHDTGDWIDVDAESFPPIMAEHDEAREAVVRIEVMRGRRGDLEGQVLLDSIWIGRLPSMVLSSGSRLNVYHDPTDVAVTCTLSGIREANPRIRFQLLDATNRELNGEQGEVLSLDGRIVAEDTQLASDIAGTLSTAGSYEGSREWRPQIPDYGFYRIRVKMLGSDESGKLTDEQLKLYTKDMTIAVFPELPARISGEFGWTLPIADRPLDFDELVELLPQVSLNWVKMPVWHAADDIARSDSIVRFAERLAASEIELIGLLTDPTVSDSTDPDLGFRPTNIANLMTGDPSFWQPLWDPVMTRLSLRVRWWQLGNDYDSSFVGYQDLVGLIRKLRLDLFRFGQDVRLGLGSRWPVSTSVSDPDASKGPAAAENAIAWEFEQFPPIEVEENQSVADELDRRLVAAGPPRGQRWVSLAADDLVLPNGPSAAPMLTNHIREFVRQMVVAKIHQADRIFVANPYGGPYSLLNRDGTPGLLLMPWRTTATVLGGARFLGSIQLPNRSQNFVFARGTDDLVMVLWNDRQTIEQLNLGPDVKSYDVWGRLATLARTRNDVQIPVGTLPTFLVGLHPAMVRWMMAVEFEHKQIPSEFGRRHPNSVSVTNFFGQGVGGTMSIEVPHEIWQNAGERNLRWRVSPEEASFRLENAAKFSLPVEIALDEASFGDQTVRIDFHVEADREYDFSVWRTLTVGLGEIDIAVDTHVDEEGRLVVTQKMRNTGERLADFRCLLYAPPRLRQRTQVFLLGDEFDTKTYLFPNGKELLGRELKLRVEEIDGNRVLVHRFIAEP